MLGSRLRLEGEKCYSIVILFFLKQNPISVRYFTMDCGEHKKTWSTRRTTLIASLIYIIAHIQMSLFPIVVQRYLRTSLNLMDERRKGHDYKLIHENLFKVSLN